MLSFRKTGSDRVGASIWLSFILFIIYLIIMVTKHLKKKPRRNVVNFLKKCLCMPSEDQRRILLMPLIFLTKNWVNLFLWIKLSKFFHLFRLSWSCTLTGTWSGASVFSNKGVQFSHLIGRLGNSGNHCFLFPI